MQSGLNSLHVMDTSDVNLGLQNEISTQTQCDENSSKCANMSAITVVEPPTLYEYYTAGGVNNGLSADAPPTFQLNDRNITLYSGAMHYFRVPPQYWRDRLKKMRAAGLNAVETYVPWNLHEPQPGVFDWGSGGTDMQDFLNLEKFLKTAQEEDLFAIVRPGPYICAEWEFGGLPSWLLREKGIKVRTSDETFMKHVRRYFNALLPILVMLQFTKGGPIIAVQVENEYGSTRVGNNIDKVYLVELKELLRQNGIEELLFTSDSAAANGDAGSVPGVLQTVNFQGNPEQEFNALKKYQPDKALMAMEYWSGWFDHWSESHHTRNAIVFANIFKRILDFPASVNMYMFHGGTNWGFMNGANYKDGSTDNGGNQPTITSYDYDAPLSEAGDYTDKYVKVKELIASHNNVITKIPETPHLIPKVAYPPVEVTEQLTLQELEDQVLETHYNLNPLPMELLPINNNSGQSYGYIVYKKINIDIPGNSVLKISGRVCDTVMVLINGVLKSKPLQQASDLNDFGYWKKKDSTLNLGPETVTGATLELVVENWGRNNFGKLNQFQEHKGLWQGPIYLNDQVLTGWQMVPLEFKKKWNKELTNWHSVVPTKNPALYRGKFTVTDPSDTFIDMRNWTKGFVIVNGFVLGRHAVIGPQRSLYLPGPFLNKGDNEILIFEHFQPDDKISFTSVPLLNN